MNITMREIQPALVDAGREIYNWHVADYQPDLEATPRKIEQILALAGADWSLGDDGRYTHEAERAWCGDFIAACARIVGRHLHEAVGERDDARGVRGPTCFDVALRPELCDGLASTFKVQSAEHWQPYDPPPEVDSIRRGTICVWDTGRGQEHGDHLTLATGPPASGAVPTLEGNGTGLKLRNGQRGEGVGYRKRDLDDLVRAHELELEHFDGAAVGEVVRLEELEAVPAGDEAVATNNDGEPCELCLEADGYCHLHPDGG